MSLWCPEQPLVLASQSQSRRMLLQNAGFNVDAIPADLDERTIQASSGLSAPGDIAQLLAGEKATAVARNHPDRIVIGADQTLSLGGQLFNKPAGREQAAKQLQRLAGGPHELHSAVAVARDGDQQIATYLDNAGTAMTASVGAYQLEKLGVHLFEQIEGDHFTILGLPLLPLLAFLRGQQFLSF
jgi:septum formation protein